MELNPDAHVDTSQVEDGRGGGGGGLPLGGGGRGGLVGLVIGIIVLLAGGGYGATQVLGGGGDSGGGDNTTINQECADSNADRTKQLDCQNTLYINSIQAFWTAELPSVFGKDYQPVDTHFFEQQVSTGCGAADSGAGPFYCPNDKKVYIDQSFYQELTDRFGAKGQFAQAYVLAHEYGHHVQDLLGRMAGVDTNAESVMLELQADCYAGVWAKHATETRDSKGNAIFTSITDQDIQDAIEVAGKIGDDALQKQAGQEVNPDTFTHGTSAQRQHWLSTGYSTGDPKACDTFGAGS
jgi:predicted metalloprotease